jgi:hypothetical protein
MKLHCEEHAVNAEGVEFCYQKLRKYMQEMSMNESCCGCRR